MHSQVSPEAYLDVWFRKLFYLAGELYQQYMTAYWGGYAAFFTRDSCTLDLLAIAFLVCNWMKGDHASRNIVKELRFSEFSEPL